MMLMVLDNVLRLLTGPTISVKVRWQIQSVVSHIQITESVPPEARYLPLGDSSTDRQDEVWPFMVNSLGWMLADGGDVPSSVVVVVLVREEEEVEPSILDRS